MAWFNKAKTNDYSSTELISEISSTQFNVNNFANVYAKTMYSKIMHECASRAMIPETVNKDGYIITTNDSYSPYKRGLISCVVDAMVSSSRVWLRKERVADDVYIFHKVYESEIREQGDEISADIIELDFREFYEAKVVSLLFELLSNVMATMSKNVTVSGALLIKIHALSEMIANSQNMQPLVKQIAQLNEGLTQGSPAFVDAKSAIEFPAYSSAPAESTASFVFSLISSITGLPNSYIFGEVVGGLGDSSSSDNMRMNSAIRKYYNSIWSGVLYSTYDKIFDYKQMVDDVNELITAFAFVESTQMLTQAGKLKFMINNTSMDKEDFTMSQSDNG